MMANSQHRCVFVGNIPYDATEEQLKQICEEVGPVVNFRLVVDRETGKPKGYGFCEYKDEETALSARRNLHGYDINGRQLRVDFAENDKNNERGKEQGRGGPGMTSNTGPQKQIGGPAVNLDPSIHQPVGLQDAMAAAILMTGTLGGGQSQTNNNNNISQNGILSQPIPGKDPLTLHLANISKGQLTEVLTEFKTMATQNKEQARQLLLAHPQLSKAVLQALIMMKLVPPHLLQMPNTRQLPGPLPQQPISGLPPVAQNKMPLGFIPQGQTQSQLPSSQYATASVPLQPRFQPVQQHPTLLSGPLQSLHHPSSQYATIGPSVVNNNGWGHNNNNNKINHHQPNIASKLLHENDQIARPPKLIKMEDGTASVPLRAGPTDTQKPNEVVPGVDAALLEQVLNLTPEQLSSLPPDQQQQVIQLQHILRQSNESRTS